MISPKFARITPSRRRLYTYKSLFAKRNEVPQDCHTTYGKNGKHAKRTKITPKIENNETLTKFIKNIVSDEIIK